MRHPLNFFQRLLLPYYSVEKIARILSLKSPVETAYILQTFNLDKSIAVLSLWSQPVQVHIINQLGDYGLKLVLKMGLKEQSGFLVRLNSRMARKLSFMLPADNLDKMLGIWTNEERNMAFTKLPAKVTSRFLMKMSIEQQVAVIRSFKPWIAAPLMETLEPEARARILDGIDFKLALDLFDRWDIVIKSSVFRLLNRNKQEEFIGAMRPRSLALILQRWSEEDALEFLLLLNADLQLNLLKRLPEEFIEKIFHQMPTNRQLMVINSSEPTYAVKLLKLVPKAVAEEILSKVKPENVSVIRALLLVSQSDD